MGARESNEEGGGSSRDWERQEGGRGEEGRGERRERGRECSNEISPWATCIYVKDHLRPSLPTVGVMKKLPLPL